MTVKCDESEETTIPIEDLGTVVIDGSQVLLTSPLLQGFATEGVALIVCDSSHMPSGLMLPLSQHSRSAEVFFVQLEASLPLKKQCWRTVVRQKILNQAGCLLKVGNASGSEAVASFAAKVGSGDKSNIEAQAARRYWNELFGSSFRRRADNGLNMALNYGYSIVRSCVARGLVARGLSPALGIHHENKLNGFNLADDFVEPFRPFADIAVWSLLREGEDLIFGKDERNKIIEIITSQVRIGGESFTIPRAAEVVASSFIDAIRANDSKKLQLPSFV